MPLLSSVPKREGRRSSLRRLSRWGDGSRRPPLHAPYHCPISVPSYFGPRERPPTALWKHGNRDPQPSLLQTILVLGSPLSPLLPPTSFSITSEHTQREPRLWESPWVVPPAIPVLLLLGLVPGLSAALQERQRQGPQRNIACLGARPGAPLGEARAHQACVI